MDNKLAQKMEKDGTHNSRFRDITLSTNHMEKNMEHPMDNGLIKRLYEHNDPCYFLGAIYDAASRPQNMSR